MTTTRILTIDAFAPEPFCGNPAAVCLLAEEREPAWMQAVAGEMNLSETAFVVPRGEGFGLRWFTPTDEVPLCGHATLASAHALWEEGLLEMNRDAVFSTASGKLLARRENDESIGLDFPAFRPRPATPRPDVLLALAAEVSAASVIDRGAEGGVTWLLELASEESVRSLAPDLSALRACEIHAVIATARATTDGFDFVSRFFAPSVGVDEDPVTGFAHCCLAPYWSELLGKKEMTALQASKRGGVLGLGVENDRVQLRGRAVTVLRGELLV